MPFLSDVNRCIVPCFVWHLRPDSGRLRSFKTGDLDLKVQKVLVLHKKTTYQIQAEEYRESRFLKLLQEKSKVVERVELAHNEHIATMEVVEAELSKRNIDYRIIARSELDHYIQDIDLMISVGGDGTFLDASHSLDKVPLLGVNSSQSSSFGHFCLANQDNFAPLLDQIMDGSLSYVNILRLRLELNGEVLPQRSLNEILVAHTIPAATSRYFMELEEIHEEHRSSGVLVGSPAGSTGTLRSAGARVLPIDFDQYQFMVREPNMRPSDNWQLLHGLVPKSKPLVITSQMRTGAIFVDGPHIVYPFALGDRLTVHADGNDLLAFVDRKVNDIFS